jgi:hypothetical protein
VRLKAVDGLSAACLGFLILTGARHGEALAFAIAR